jgi:glycosyltransferase involved in cell wall biosynthesis
MKRVAYVCADPGVPVFGSDPASLRVQQLLRALQAPGGQVQLFAAQLGGARPDGLEHVRVHTLAPLPKPQGVERERAALRANAELRSLLEDNGRFDVIYERYSLWSYAGMEAAAAAHIAGALDVPAALLEDAVARGVLVDRDAAEQVSRRAFGAAGAVIVGSRKLANYLHHRFPQTCARTTVVPPALDPSRYPPRAQPFERRRPGAFTIASVSTTEPPYGHTLMLDAFDQLRGSVAGARLIICGESSQSETLGAQIAERGLGDAVDVIHRVNEADVAELLDRVDIAVAAHDRRVDFNVGPLALYEYMAAGVPVVASRIVELEGLIEDGATGLLCTPGDTAALARAVELLAGNPLLRARLGSEGRTHVLQRYTWNAHAERVLNFATVLATPVTAA